jgi:hypothetical protein
MNPKEIFGNVLSNKWQKLKDMTATTLWGYGIKEGKKTTTIEWESLEYQDYPPIM